MCITALSLSQKQVYHRKVADSEGTTEAIVLLAVLQAVLHADVKRHAYGNVACHGIVAWLAGVLQHLQRAW